MRTCSTTLQRQTDCQVLLFKKENSGSCPSGFWETKTNEQNSIKSCPSHANRCFAGHLNYFFAFFIFFLPLSAQVFFPLLTKHNDGFKLRLQFKALFQMYKLSGLLPIKKTSINVLYSMSCLVYVFIETHTHISSSFKNLYFWPPLLGPRGQVAQLG